MKFIRYLLIVLVVTITLAQFSQINMAESNIQENIKGEVKSAKTLEEAIDGIKPNNLKLKKTLKADVDKDGNEEIILGYGANNGDRIQKIYLIKKINNMYSNYGELNVGNNLWDVRLANIYNNGTKSIICELEGERPEYYLWYNKIYKFQDNRISEDERIPIEEKNGDETIINHTILFVDDFNKDGVDEITLSNIYSNHIQQPKVNRYLKWNGKKFEEYKEEISYSYDNPRKEFIYPKEPELVVINYIQDYVFNIHGEIDRFIANSKIKNINVKKENYNFLDTGRLYFYPQILFKTQNKVVIKAVSDLNIENTNVVYYGLTLKNGKWKITDISKSRPDNVPKTVSIAAKIRSIFMVDYQGFCDGAISEAFSGDITDAFLEEPEVFIKELAKIPQGKQKHILNNLYLEEPENKDNYSNQIVIKDYLSVLKKSLKLNKTEMNILENIIPKTVNSSSINNITRIGNISYSSKALVKGKSEKLKIVINDSNVSKLRKLKLEVYVSKNKIPWTDYNESPSPEVKMAPNSKAAECYLNVNFPETGLYYTRVQVYSEGKLVATRIGKYADKVVSKN